MRLIIIDGIADVDTLIRTMREVGVVETRFALPKRVTPEFMEAQVEKDDAIQALNLLEGTTNASPVYDAMVKKHRSKGRPVDPNSFRQLMIAFINVHPGSTTRDVQRAFPGKSNLVREYLSRCKIQGILKAVNDGGLNRYYTVEDNHVLCNQVSSQYAGSGRD